MNLSAQGSRHTGEKKSASTTEEVVHTPASLFARLRKELQDRELVRYITSLSNFEDLHPSDFVEFEATLRRSPIIDILNSFSEILPLAKLADIEASQTADHGRNTKKRRTSHKQNEFSVIEKQIDLIRSAVTAEGSQDFIAEIDRLRVVLTTEQDYFIDPSMNDIIDGTFRVFGKVTRIVDDNTESISLLRRTAAGKFRAIADALVPAMESLQDTGFGHVETAIIGPTMQVIPIAIFS